MGASDRNSSRESIGCQLPTLSVFFFYPVYEYIYTAKKKGIKLWGLDIFDKVHAERIYMQPLAKRGIDR